VIPQIRFAERRQWVLLIIPVVTIGFWMFHHGLEMRAGGKLVGPWLVFMVSVLWHLTLAWTDRPFKVTPRQERGLDRLFVTVNVPVYNEDPQTLRRVAYSLFAQDRLPNRIQFVDDGSTRFDYRDVAAEVRSLADFYPEVDCSWIRKGNGGKRNAQAVTFNDGGRADIFVTVDSDSTLDPSAIREGLKPFADPNVASVAAIVVLSNARRNFLTRLTELWLTAFQTFVRAAWSRLGCVLVNSGGLALYRADIIRTALPAYTSETFGGRPVHFSDDSLLTLYALLSGRTVQQSSSFVFTEMPETLNHHFRQQIRWMRGSFIRAWWRFRYLPFRGFAYWEHLLMWVTFAMATVLFISVFVSGPMLDGRLLPALAGLALALVLTYAASSRFFMIVREDQPVARQLVTFGCAPLVALWLMLVLRPLRLYSMVTCRKTGWGTRAKVEVSLGKPKIEVALGREA
jgi:hyaluronan synthase